jgi:hypothetical protein
VYPAILLRKGDEWNTHQHARQQSAAQGPVIPVSQRDPQSVRDVERHDDVGKLNEQIVRSIPRENEQAHRSEEHHRYHGDGEPHPAFCSEKDEQPRQKRNTRWGAGIENDPLYETYLGNSEEVPCAVNYGQQKDGCQNNTCNTFRFCHTCYGLIFLQRYATEKTTAYPALLIFGYLCGKLRNDDGKTFGTEPRLRGIGLGHTALQRVQHVRSLLDRRGCGADAPDRADTGGILLADHTVRRLRGVGGRVGLCVSVIGCVLYAVLLALLLAMNL